MKRFLLSALLLISLGHSATCAAGQKETIPDLKMEWVVYLPRIPYPFEARRSGGLGTYIVDMNPRDGRALRVSVETRAISKVLDEEALRWLMNLRLKRGCPPRVRVKIIWRPGKWGFHF